MLKRIYEELIAIRNEIKEIRKHVEPKGRIENGIFIRTFFPNQPIQPTAVSFELDYRDWLKLEKSKEWKDFQKLLLKYQKGYNRKFL